MKQTYQLQMYKARGNLVQNEDGGQQLISGPKMPMVSVPRTLKDVAANEKNDSATLNAYHNFHGQFNTSVPPWYQIWFNL